MLGDRDLARMHRDGELKVEPLSDGWLQPTSIDLRLDRHFLTFRDREPLDTILVIDPAQDSTHRMESFEATDERPFILSPGRFALGATFETVGLNDRLAARIEGKSSLGRLGLVVHSTAGFIDPGFEGQITLELFNFAPAPLMLRPGMKIAQLCIFELMSRVDTLYGSASTKSRYQGQVGPTPSRSHLNWSTVSTAREA